MKFHVGIKTIKVGAIQVLVFLFITLADLCHALMG
jgi:hypothetical protein